MKPQMNDTIADKCLNRHWCPQSEHFTGADSLLTRLHHGWDIIAYQVDRTHYCRTQQIKVYVFDLFKDGKTETMHVVATPYMERFLAQQPSIQMVMA